MRATAAVFLITIGLWMMATAQAEMTATAYQTINVRSGPGTQFEIVGQLAEGDAVPVNGRESEATRWYHIILPDGQQGWVSSFTVDLNGEPDGLPIIEPDGEIQATSVVRIITYGRVNVRSGPGINYDVVGQLDVGEEAPALARNNRSNDWLYIEHEIVNGWVAYFTVDVIGDAGTLPIRVPDGNGEELVAPTSLIRARYNIRVRETPDSASAIIGLVDFDSRVTPVARSEDGRWLYIAYENIEGWALTELFEISESYLSTLPIFTPRSQQLTLEATAEITPEPASP
jgi:N-acetylmuramoyl-L-alanine amidase